MGCSTCGGVSMRGSRLFSRKAAKVDPEKLKARREKNLAAREALNVRRAERKANREKQRVLLIEQSQNTLKTKGNT